MCVCVCVPHLSVPDRVGGVGDDGGATFLSVVCERRQAPPPAWLDGHLQVRVRVEEHALLQTQRTQVCTRTHTHTHTHTQESFIHMEQSQ